MIQIVTDVCGDLEAPFCREHDILVMPMHYMLDGEEIEYTPQTFSASDFYGKMRKGSSSGTSQINTEDFLAYFEPIAAEGKDLIFISLSSGLSGSYHNAAAAAEELSQKYPGVRLHAVDSLGASMGEGLLAYTAACLRDEGLSFDEIVAALEEKRHCLHHWFTVDDLKYLRRGGRVSAAAAMVGTLLAIKPVLQCNQAGKLVPVEKVKGRKRAIRALVESVDKFGVDIDGQTIFISDGDAREEALQIRDMISEKHPTCSFVMGSIGAVIGAHSGPGTLAIFFYGTKRTL